MTYELILQALADPSRRRILEKLRGRALSVSALASGLPISRPAVSQHLKILRVAGLVGESRQGTRHLFRILPGGLAHLRDYLDWLES